MQFLTSLKRMHFMLKKILISMVVVGSILSPVMLSAQDTGAGTTTRNVIDPAFNSKLDAALQKAEADVQQNFDRATTRANIPTWESKLSLENAVIQLEVKKTLVANFKGKDSLQSPLVREKLLEVLNKSIVTQADLAELQSIVNQEKTRLNIK